MRAATIILLFKPRRDGERLQRLRPPHRARNSVPRISRNLCTAPERAMEIAGNSPLRAHPNAAPASTRTASADRRARPHNAPQLRNSPGPSLSAAPSPIPFRDALSGVPVRYRRQPFSTGFAFLGHAPGPRSSTVAAVHISFAHSLSRLSFGSNSPARRHSSRGYYAGMPASVSRSGFSTTARNNGAPKSSA